MMILHDPFLIVSQSRRAIGLLVVVDRYKNITLYKILLCFSLTQLRSHGPEALYEQGRGHGHVERVNPRVECPPGGYVEHPLAEGPHVLGDALALAADDEDLPGVGVVGAGPEDNERRFM